MNARFNERKKYAAPLVLSLAILGCTHTLNPDADGMKAAALPSETDARASKYFGQISVGKIVVEETGGDAYREIVVEEVELREALEESLSAARLLSAGRPEDAQYILNATVIKTPLGEESGLLTITAYVQYELLNRVSGTVAFKETIAGWEKARFGPVQTYHEQAFRENIETLLSRLTSE